MVILIADDEKLVRYSLKSMLEEIEGPARSIQLARDGPEMIEKVCSTHPDLAFVDIKMPRLNGLEAIARARSLSPHTRWIILTSYSSFDFAKRAIELGAEDYLLKPVSPEELSQVVRRIWRTNKQDFLRLNHEFEAHLNALFHNTLSIDHDAEAFISNAVFAGALLVFDSQLGEKELLSRQLGACDLIRKKLIAAVSKTTRLALCTLPEGQLALVGAWQQGTGAAESEQSIYSLFRKIPALVGTNAPGGVRMTQLLGETCGSYNELLEQLYLLNELAPLRVVQGIGSQIPLSSLRDGQGQPRRLSFCRSLASLSEAFRHGTYLEFLRLSDEVEIAWRDWCPAAEPPARRRILRFLEVALSFRPSRGLNGGDWHRELRSHGERFLSHRGREGPGNLAEQAMQFVADNYMRNIGIAQIAFDLGVTPNYLSHVFHKHTGTPFVKYITRLRMLKARELLGDPSSRVQQVARRVGYLSTRHFSKLFKQYFEVSPSAFLTKADRKTS